MTDAMMVTMGAAVPARPLPSASAVRRSARRARNRAARVARQSGAAGARARARRPPSEPAPARGDHPQTARSTLRESRSDRSAAEGAGPLERELRGRRARPGGSLGLLTRRRELRRRCPHRWGLDRVDARGASFSDAELSDASAVEACFDEAVLAHGFATGANMNGASFARARLPSANLSGALLEKTIFREADLDRADFGAAKLDGADLSGASMEDTNLAGASAREVNFERICVRTSAPRTGPTSTKRASSRWRRRVRSSRRRVWRRRTCPAATSRGPISRR